MDPLRKAVVLDHGPRLIHLTRNHQMHQVVRGTEHVFGMVGKTFPDDGLRLLCAAKAGQDGSVVVGHCEVVWDLGVQVFQQTQRLL